MMKRCVALLMLVGSLTACDSGSPDDLAISDLTQNPALLVGTWEWQRSVSYTTGNRCLETPATAGRAEAVEFGADGAYRKYVDGEVVLTGTYEAGNGGIRVQGADGAFSLGSFGVGDGDLILSTEALDGPRVYYSRVD